MNTFINSLRFNFLFVDRYSFGKTWVYPESLVPYNMLRYIVKGSAAFFINGEEIIVKQSQIVYLPQACLLSCHALEDGFTFYSIRFTTSVHYEGGDFLADYYGVPRVTHCDDGQGINYFEQIYHWVRAKKDSRMFWVRGYLELLIGFIIEKNETSCSMQVRNKKEYTGDMEKISLRVRKSDVKMDARIQVVVDYIILHPDEDFTAKSMCLLAELSESRFRKLFKAQLGKTPNEYLTELRIMTAARKLLTSGDDVGDIGYNIGFKDSNYFIRVFKKYFGLTPKQYRENAKN